MTDRYEIALTGCSPTPLASYLKGLALLRLIDRIDRTVRASWNGESLLLYTRLSEQELRKYLLNEYRPTPILAPWNGGSGFYEKDNKEALHAILGGTTERLAVFRQCLAIAETGLVGVDRSASPKGKEKQQLLQRMRGLLPDDALDWFDAAVLLSGEEPKYPPLLGTGGNDGRLDFTNNFMQRLVDVMDPDSGEPTVAAADWLNLSLYAQPAPGLAKSAIGQFSPGHVGGPNASTGYEGSGGTNPWDFVLMIEGALPFAAAAVRRNATEGDGVLSYPFTVRANAAGSGGLGAADGGSARGELWMPLWAKPASYGEIRALLAEGRVALGTRPARDALDFVRAVHRLGGYRGVDRFQRYGLLMRSGKAFLAAPIERVQVTRDPQSDFIDELEREGWLDRFRRFAAGDNAALRFVALRQRLENQLFELAQRQPTAARVQSLLMLLGEIQRALSASRKARESLRPVPHLSARWTSLADDGSPAFRIACALAGLRGVGDQPLPLRAQCFPLHPRWHNWIDSTVGVRLQTPRGNDLSRSLIALLERRLWLTMRLDMADKPLGSPAGIDFADLDAFLRQPRLDARIEYLLYGLAHCEIPPSIERSAGEGMAPAAFGLLRLALLPDSTLRRLGHLRDDQRLPIPAGMVGLLASGQPAQACRAVEMAWRRLRGSGLTPVLPRGALPSLAGIDPRRVAAALLIPLTLGASAVLARRLLTADEEQPTATSV